MLKMTRKELMEFPVEDMIPVELFKDDVSRYLCCQLTDEDNLGVVRWWINPKYEEYKDMIREITTEYATLPEEGKTYLPLRCIGNLSKLNEPTPFYVGEGKNRYGFAFAKLINVIAKDVYKSCTVTDLEFALNFVEAMAEYNPEIKQYIPIIKTMIAQKRRNPPPMWRMTAPANERGDSFWSWLNPFL